MTDFQLSNHGDAYDPARHFDATHPTHGLSDHWRVQKDDVTFPNAATDERNASQLGPFGKAVAYTFGSLVLAYFLMGLFVSTH